MGLDCEWKPNVNQNAGEKIVEHLETIDRNCDGIELRVEAECEPQCW